MLTYFFGRGSFDREYRTQAVAPTGSETVATYLNKRLKQIGVGHVFCIPGDYLAEWAETLDDPAQNAGLVRVHPNNEMCAAYAADGYGRVANGPIGCVAFTYGAGSINAAQAIAGAYVERSPVVVINGSPSVAQFHSTRDQGVLYHHMVRGEDTDLRIFSEITELAVRIDNPATAPALIDAALQTCLTASRPVYIELASQTAHMACSQVPTGRLQASPIPAAPASVSEACGAVLAHLRAAKRVVLVAGSEIARKGLQDGFAQLVSRIDAPYVTSPLGKSVCPSCGRTCVSPGSTSAAAHRRTSSSSWSRLTACSPWACSTRTSTTRRGDARLQPGGADNPAGPRPHSGPGRRRPGRARPGLLGRRRAGGVPRRSARRAGRRRAA